MRRITVLVAGLGLLLGGCGGPGPPPSPPAGPASTLPAAPDPVPPDPGWEGTTELDFATGALTAPGFNELIDAQAPDWATDPLTTVSVLLRLDRADGQVEADVQGGGSDPMVVVTNSQLADDSVAAIRYRITLTEGSDGRYRFAAGEATWRCQPERGQQDFGTDVCL